MFTIAGSLQRGPRPGDEAMAMPDIRNLMVNYAGRPDRNEAIIQSPTSGTVSFRDKDGPPLLGAAVAHRKVDVWVSA